jgi:hypothetical protein
MIMEIDLHKTSTTILGGFVFLSAPKMKRLMKVMMRGRCVSPTELVLGASILLLKKKELVP